MPESQPKSTQRPRAAIPWRHRSIRSGRRLGLLVGLVTAGLCATGCGGSASASSQIRATLRAAADGLLHGHGQQVCNTLTQSAIDTLVSEASSSGEDCAQIVDTASGDLAADTKATLRNIHFTYLHISGDHATGEDSSSGTAGRAGEAMA